MPVGTKHRQQQTADLCKEHLWWKKCTSSAAPSVVALITSLLFLFEASCYQQSKPFLQHRPNPNDLVGEYVLERNTHERLRLMGYADLSARVLLKSDGTMEILRMPEEWMRQIYGTEEHGFDSCNGTWRVDVDQYGNYNITLGIKGFLDGSTFLKAKRLVMPPETGFLIIWGFSIADKGQYNAGYSLAVPLESGDDGYLIFISPHENKVVPSP